MKVTKLHQSHFLTSAVTAIELMDAYCRCFFPIFTHGQLMDNDKINDNQIWEKDEVRYLEKIRTFSLIGNLSEG